MKIELFDNGFAIIDKKGNIETHFVGGDPSGEPVLSYKDILKAAEELQGGNPPPWSIDFERRVEDRGPISAERKDFVWTTHKNAEQLRPSEMATPHLFHAVRMLWNNIVPPVFRVDADNFRRYGDVKRWSNAYIERAAYELTKELINRPDYDSTIKEVIEDIFANAKVIQQLGL